MAAGYEVAPFVASDDMAREIAAAVEKEAADSEPEPEPEPEPEVPDSEPESSPEGLADAFRAAVANRRAAFSANASSDALSVFSDEFEKDEDSNGHVDFLHSAANLRARTYSLSTMEWVDVKLKAGRIIPALVTTTAVVAGLLCTELVKVLAHQRNVGCEARQEGGEACGANTAATGWPIERFKSTFLNLAVPNFFQSEPGRPEVHSIPSAEGSALVGNVDVWSRWEVPASGAPGAVVTLEGVVEQLQQEHAGVRVRDIFFGARPLFFNAPDAGASTYTAEEGRAGVGERRTPLVSLLGGVVEQDAKYVDLVVTLATSETEAVAGPPVRVHLRPSEK
jgi:hypothetical protein